MNTTKTFAKRCTEACDAAWEQAHPFVPSMAELEQSLALLVVDLCAMERTAAEAYIRATFHGRELQPLALKLYKDRVGRRWRPTVGA